MPAHPTPQRRLRLRRRTARGFTLMEAALTTVIIGVGVLSIVEAQQAYHKKNDWAARVGTAQLLANELRELTISLPYDDPLTGQTYVGPEPGETTLAHYDDLDDFAGAISGNQGAGLTFNPPINALRLPIADLDQWTQTIRVENVLDDYMDASVAPPLGSTNLMRVTVTVLYQGPDDPSPQVITSLTWVIAGPQAGGSIGGA